MKIQQQVNAVFPEFHQSVVSFGTKKTQVYSMQLQYWGMVQLLNYQVPLVTILPFTNSS